jgi:transposase
MWLKTPVRQPVLLKARVAANPNTMNIGGGTVELSFGAIKQLMGQRDFLMRCLENLRGEFSITALPTTSVVQSL